MTENSNEFIDKAQIDNLKQLFNEGFNDFIIGYFNEFEKKEKELSVAIDQKSFENIKKIAHALKGSSLNVGASALAKVCSEIEVAGKQGNYETSLKEYTDLKSLYPQVKEQYIKYTS